MHPSTTHLAGRTALQLLAVFAMLAALLAPMLIGSAAWAESGGALLDPPQTDAPATTTEEELPFIGTGNPGCPDLGFSGSQLKLESDSEGDDQDLTNGIKPLGGDLSITISGLTETFFDFSSAGIDVLGVIVKGGAIENPEGQGNTDAFLLYDYRSDGVAADTGLHAYDDFEISHISFCYRETPPTEATLSVTKTVVVGENADDPAGPFGFTVDCGEGRTDDFTLTDGQTWDAPAGWDLIVGDSCTVTETNTQDADSTTAEWNAVAHTLGTDTELTVADNDVEVTNTYDDVILPTPATLSVTKTVDLGENREEPESPFGFTVDCGEDRTDDFTLTDGQTWDAPAEWDLIVGDSCTVTETNTQDADSTTAEWNAVAHTLGTDTELTVADNDVEVTNTYDDVAVEGVIIEKDDPAPAPDPDPAPDVESEELAQTGLDAPWLAVLSLLFLSLGTALVRRTSPLMAGVRRLSR